LRRHVGHGGLERVVAAGAKGLARQHVHLLVGSLELLLLLLQQLDLLLDRQLLHWGGG
jgi:hypothetical protein